MARTRRARADLTESWDDVGSGSQYEEEEEEERWQDSDEDSEDRPGTRQGRERDTRKTRFDAQEDRRETRSSGEGPQLVMPASPNATGANGNKNHARGHTPRMRLNERSMTAGPNAAAMAKSSSRQVDRGERTKTPRFRMNARSMTSDAGAFAGRAAAAEYEDEEEDSLMGYVHLAWNRILAPLVAYLGDIVGMVFANAKPLIAYLLFAYLIGAALIFASGFLTNSISNALTPICRIPGVTYLFDPSFCPLSTKSSSQGITQGPAEFDKLVQAQSAFNEVLDSASTGANLPLDMKRSEAGIRDLKHVVQYSTLASRNELVYEFDGFVSTARDASRDLSKFNSRIGRAVDHILSTNRWTLGIISDISAEEQGRGSVSKFFSNHLNIFAPFQPVSLSRDVLLDQYLRHTGAVEEQIQALITEAQALLGVLDNLDSRLDIIASIATRDGLKAEENRDELFAYLWTKLGGNRSSVKKLDQQLQLLRDVGSYRRIAWAHVSTTIVKLQAIRDNLEDLRERVAMPETIGTDKVPLEVHIDAINLGIKRLEEQRDTSRRLENENYRRVVERAERGAGKMIGESGG